MHGTLKSLASFRMIHNVNFNFLIKKIIGFGYLSEREEEYKKFDKRSFFL